MAKTPNLLAANTAQYPYWIAPGVQVPNLIPGQQMAGEIQDIGINRIPSETDYNQSDIRTIPTPDSPSQQVGQSIQIQAHRPELGRGASIGLTDLLIQSVQVTQRIAANQ